MTFDPSKINLQQTNCDHQGRRTVCVQTKLCFTYSIKSDKGASASPQLTGRKKKSVQKVTIIIPPGVSVIGRHEPL